MRGMTGGDEGWDEEREEWWGPKQKGRRGWRERGV